MATPTSPVIDRVDNYTSKVHFCRVQKNVPHHSLSGVQAKFAGVESLEITISALRSANAIGYSLEDVVDVVQSLEKRDFVKSETQHSPANSRVWHIQGTNGWNVVVSEVRG